MFASGKTFDSFAQMLNYEISETESWLERARGGAIEDLERMPDRFIDSEDVVGRVLTVARAAVRLETLKEILNEYTERYK